LDLDLYETKNRICPKQTFMSSKSWVCTLNNWTQPEYDHLVEMYKDHMTSLLIGKETAPTTGTPHLQIYLTLKQNRTLRWMKDTLTERGCWQKAKGDYAQNLTYISKEDTEPLVMTSTKQGARTDLVGLWTLLREGGSMEKVMDTNPCLQHILIAEKFFKHAGRKRADGPRECYWFWGPTGVGKTRDAIAMDPESYCVIDCEKGVRNWFCPYKNQRVLILDELRPDSVSFKTLLTWMDRYTRWVETKGGGCWGNWDVVVVTSPLPPHAFTDGTGFEQLERRLKEVVEYERHENEMPISKPVYKKK